MAAAAAAVHFSREFSLVIRCDDKTFRCLFSIIVPLEKCPGIKFNQFGQEIRRIFDRCNFVNTLTHRTHEK